MRVKRPGQHWLWLLALCIGLTAGACTHVPPNNADSEQALEEDPIEPVNRAIFEFNRIIDGLILRPLASIYRGIVPEYGRERVTNALENIYTPVVFANSVLQADPQNSFASFWRFAINSTIGIAGMFDVASEIPLRNRHTDLGQTLAIYGAGPGPYIVLPIIGPSNGRDAIGRLGDALMNPFNYVDEGFSIALWSTTAVDARSNNMKLLDDTYSSSLDPYATFRSGYKQKRASDIRKATILRKQSLEKAGFQ